MAWKLKLNDDGSVAVKDNAPLYVDDTGAEVVFDPNQMHGKILELNSESKKRREENKALKDRMTLFEGIEDLAGYKQQADEALKVVQNLKDKDLVKAGEVEKLKTEMRAGFDEQEKKLKEQFQTRESDWQKQVSAKDAAIRKLMVSNQFATSPLFSGDSPRTILPADMAETYFGRYFEVQTDGGKLQLVAKDDKGEPIFSRQRIGELADFNEAIELIFDRYPGKDKLIRAQGGGSGSGGGNTGGGAGLPSTPVAKLKASYDQAVKDGDVLRQIALKTALHKMNQDQRR